MEEGKESSEEEEESSEEEEESSEEKEDPQLQLLRELAEQVSKHILCLD